MIIYQINTKILILIPAFNRPDFIEVQYKTFEKFLQYDYELMVFNDANNVDMEYRIKSMCDKFNITYIRVPQEIHNIYNPKRKSAEASFRHGEVLQFAMENFGFKHNDFVFLIDSDVFLIRPFCIRKYMREFDVLGFCHDDGTYWITPNFCIFNMPKLSNPYEMNFRANILNNGMFLEVGSQTQNYIKKYLNIRWKKREKYINSIFDIDVSCKLQLDLKKDIMNQLEYMGYSNPESNLIKQLIECYKIDPKGVMDFSIGFYEKNIFLDYQHGSGWYGPNDQNLRKKDRLIYNFINEIIAK